MILIYVSNKFNMENNFIILYGWKESWGKLQKILLIDDETSDKLLPNKYKIPELDEDGRIIFDVDRVSSEWDCLGIILRNDQVNNSTIPFIDRSETIISRDDLNKFDRELIDFLKDKPDLLEALSGEPKLYMWKNL